MRRLAPVILLLSAAACSRGMKKAEAEAALRAKYPVVVPVKVPGRVSAATGSPEAVRAQAFMDNLQKTGWFDIAKTDGKTGNAVYTFPPKTGAPVQPSGMGWLVPAAQAVFVQGTHHTEQGDTAKVTYQIGWPTPRPSSRSSSCCTPPSASAKPSRATRSSRSRAAPGS